MNSELFPFSVSKQGKNTWRVFDGNHEQLVEVDPNSSDFSKTLLAMLWEMPREKRAEDVGFVKQAAIALAEDRVPAVVEG